MRGHRHDEIELDNMRPMRRARLCAMRCSSDRVCTKIDLVAGAKALQARGVAYRRPTGSSPSLMFDNGRAGLMRWTGTATY
jgi:hypothetical protein